MACIINGQKNVSCILISESDEDFVGDSAYDYFNALIYEKQTELNQYLNVYNELSDKDSFKAEYIDSLIFLLRSEIKELQKSF